MNLEELGHNISTLSSLKGKFLLRSGATSDRYFDKYLFESHPTILRVIAGEMKKRLPEETEILAGLALGGIPIVILLSYLTDLPSVFVRKEAKEYGTCKRVEGIDVASKGVAIIEDVVTSGGQVIDSAEALRELGGTVSDVLCVIDREAGAEENLENHGLKLHSLFKMSELKESIDQRDELLIIKRLLEPLFPRYLFEIWRPNLLGIRHFDPRRYAFGDTTDSFMVELKKEKIRFLTNEEGKAPCTGESPRGEVIAELPEEIEEEILVQSIKNLIAMHRFTIV